MSNGSQNHHILQIVGFKLCMVPLIAKKLFIMLIIVQSISHNHSHPPMLVVWSKGKYSQCLPGSQREKGFDYKVASYQRGPFTVY